MFTLACCVTDLCFSWRIFVCYCRSFLYVNFNLAKKLRSTKMLSHKLKMSHKHKMSSFVTLKKKNLKSQRSIFIANDSFHLLAFAARISMFSVSTNRLLQLCLFPVVPINSPSGWYQRATFLAYLHADTHIHRWVLALCSNKKKTPLIWESSMCVTKAISVFAASWAECKPTLVTLSKYDFVKGSRKHDFQALCEDELK